MVWCDKKSNGKMSSRNKKGDRETERGRKNNIENRYIGKKRGLRVLRDGQWEQMVLSHAICIWTHEKHKQNNR